MSDSNEDDEELVESFYDLLHRSPGVDNVLQELRKSSLQKAWHVDLQCRLLLSFEVDSLLNPNVVDWNDFHLSYLESISKHRGTNKKNPVLRSHDQVDNLDAGTAQRYGFVTGKLVSTIDASDDCVFTFIGFLN